MSYEILTEKLLKGSSKKTLYYVAVVPINASGHVLLGERKGDGIWTTPGGGANEGETPEQAAIREAWEEAGLAIIPSMLELVCVKATPNGKPIHCFMVRTNQTEFSVMMDPDREVGEWKWYSKEELPAGLSRQKNHNRLETINQALMKFFGLTKAVTPEERRRVMAFWMMDPECQGETVEDLTDERIEELAAKLNKGGPGSGVKGHKTAKTSKPSKDAEIASNMAEAHRQMVATSNEANLRAHPQYNEDDHKHLKGKGYSDSEIKAIWDRDRKDQKKPVGGKVKAPDAVGHAHGDQKTEPQKMRDARRGIKNEEDDRTEAQKMADTRRGGPNFKRDWKKSESEVLSLADKLSKGGPGSGVKGHRSVNQDHKDLTVHRIVRTGGKGTLEVKSGKGDKHYYRDDAGEKHEHNSRAEAVEAAGHYVDNTDGHAGPNNYVGGRRQSLTKGGQGSGVKGHVTAKQPSPLHPEVHSDPAKPINKLSAHLQSLHHGGVMPGLHTKSGKPVANDMDVARAHGYDVQDHVDAMNAHYELANKTQQMLDKFQMAGHKVPEEGKKIAKFHQDKMKEHMKARAYLEKRKEHVEGVLKDKEGEHAEARKKYLASLDKSMPIEWLEKLHQGMQHAQYGDEPVKFEVGKGAMHLSKVDDGVYSGVFLNGPDAEVGHRLDRLSVPQIVEFMTAQGWIAPVNEMYAPEPMQAEPARFFNREELATRLVALVDKLLS